MSTTPIQKDVNDAIKIFILAGEESGDAHGAKLVNEIRTINPSVEFVGHGGDKMKAAGVDIIEHIEKLSLVGFTEVVKHLPYMWKVMRTTISIIKDLQPTRIILIDYPGFNLRLAKKIKHLNIPVTYFILPQVWAWDEKRAYQIKKLIEQPLSIIPFEKDWFAERKIDIEFVGHPFAELEQPTIPRQLFHSKHGLALNFPVLALLPGSRQSEVDRHWPIYLETVNRLHNIFPNLQFVLGKAPNVVIPECPDYIKIETEEIRALMRFSNAGLIASGTATLEAAVLGLPAVVCYKTSRTTYWIGSQLMKADYFSLVNLISDQKVIPEFIQDSMTPRALVKALIPLLSDTPERNKMTDNYKHVVEKLGKGNVYRHAAGIIMDEING